jgi:uncharacterized protein YggT (Ycf19 family)
MSLFISRVLDLYLIIIIIRVIFSWVNPQNPSNFQYLIYRLTEPVLNPVRKIIPPIGGILDISPIIVLFIIVILKKFLI